MRVSFFVNNYAPSRGGVQELVGRVAEGLVERHGMDVHVLTSDALLSPAGPSPGWIDSGDYVLRGVSVHRRRTARRLHSCLRMLRRAAKRTGLWDAGENSLLQTGPLGLRYGLAARHLARRSDVVVGVSSPSASLWYASRLGSGTPVAAMPLLHLDEEEPRPWVLRALRSADVVVANSPVERRWLLGHGVARVEVLSPGSDRQPVVRPDEARLRLGLDPVPTVGFVGRMAVHKGLDTLVAAMREVWTEVPGCTLVLAGPEVGFDVDALLDDLSDQERGRVLRWGEFRDEDRRWVISACDLIAHPSRSESFGMATTEAWSCARPVVVGDIEVTRSLVSDGVDGVLVAVDDSAALARAIVRLLRSAEDRERLGQAGRERVRLQFSWPVIIDGWASLLRSLADPEHTAGSC